MKKNKLIFKEYSCYIVPCFIYLVLMVHELTNDRNYLIIISILLFFVNCLILIDKYRTVLRKLELYEISWEIKNSHAIRSTIDKDTYGK